MGALLTLGLLQQGPWFGAIRGSSECPYTVWAQSVPTQCSSHGTQVRANSSSILWVGFFPSVFISIPVQLVPCSQEADYHKADLPSLLHGRRFQVAQESFNTEGREISL